MGFLICAGSSSDVNFFINSLNKPFIISLTRWNQRLDCPHLANTLEPTCLDTLGHARLHTFEKPVRPIHKGFHNGGRPKAAPLCGGGRRPPTFVDGSVRCFQTCGDARVPTCPDMLVPTYWRGVGSQDVGSNVSMN